MKYVHCWRCVQPPLPRTYTHVYFYDDHTSLVQALVGEAARALRLLSKLLLPADSEASPLLEELSFDLFPPILRSASQCPLLARPLLDAIVQAASPREVFCLIMDAFTDSDPLCCLLLLGYLPGLLPKLQRKRVQFLTSCFGSLTTLFLHEWPGSEWDSVQEQLQVAA